MSLKITPLTGSVGAQVEGVTLSKPLSDAQFKELHAAFLEHCVLVFRDQPLQPSGQLAFARRWGEPMVTELLSKLTIGATSCAGWKLNSRQASAPMPCVTAWSLDQLQTAKIEIHCKGAQLLL